MCDLKSALLLMVLTCLLESTTSNDILPVTKTTQTDKAVQIPDINQTMLDQAFANAEKDAASRLAIEDALPPSGFVQATLHSVEARHQRFLAFKNRTSELDQDGHMLDSASRYLVQTLGLSYDQATFGLKNVVLRTGTKGGSVRDQCKSYQTNNMCDPKSKYRTIDASCNNLKHPTWGMSLTCFGRILRSHYADGVSAPRQPNDTKPLPNPRTISLKVHEALVTPNGSFTHMMMGFGQFVNHDVTMGLMTRSIRNHTMLSCCPYGESKHPECSMGIQILKNKDDFYTQQGQTCMNFVRSATCSEDCALGPREHSNQVTTYVDNSNVYGSIDSDSLLLRTMQNGTLKSQFYNGQEFPPADDYPDTDQCTIAAENKRCFAAGDKRVNEQPMLSSMHTVWLREHNRLARGFKELNESASDEELFQLARRVLTAQYQNIVFNEYMTTLIGPAYMEYFDLTPGKASSYDPALQCTLFNEFMTAANRFGHVLIQNTIQQGTNSKDPLNLSDVYLSPYILFLDGKQDPVVAGLASQPGKAFDPHLTTTVTHDLYKQKQLPFGMDLAALNIQRGRDQGTAGYIDYIQHCFGITITSFDELGKFMNETRWKNLKKVYGGKIKNVDLFTGGVSETPLVGAVVGPTFGCLQGIQANRLKFGDRFYFEHSDQSGSFTEAQLTAIRQTNFSSVICRNSDAIAKIARNVFMLTDTAKNPTIECKGVPNLDLTLFMN